MSIYRVNYKMNGGSKDSRLVEAMSMREAAEAWEREREAQGGRVLSTESIELFDCRCVIRKRQEAAR